MKKIIFSLMLVFIVTGCQSNEEKIDENTKVDSAKVESKTKLEEINNLLKADGIKDMSTVKDSAEEIVLENDSCKVEVYLKDGKTYKIVSQARFDDIEPFTCVYRTLIKDKDLLDRDKSDFEKYIELFRDKDEFEIKGVKVKRSENTIEFTKEG